MKRTYTLSALGLGFLLTVGSAALANPTNTAGEAGTQEASASNNDNSTSGGSAMANEGSTADTSTNNSDSSSNSSAQTTRGHTLASCLCPT